MRSHTVFNLEQRGVKSNYFGGGFKFVILIVYLLYLVIKIYNYETLCINCSALTN